MLTALGGAGDRIYKSCKIDLTRNSATCSLQEAVIFPAHKNIAVCLSEMRFVG